MIQDANLLDAETNKDRNKQWGLVPNLSITNPVECYQPEGGKKHAPDKTIHWEERYLLQYVEYLFTVSSQLSRLKWKCLHECYTVK